MKDVLGGTVMLLLVLGLVAAVGIYVAGGGDGTWTFESRIVVNRNRDEVLTFLSEPEERTTWVQGLKESKLLDASRAYEGARMREMVQVDGDMEERTVEILSYDPGNKLALRTTSSSGLHMTEEFSFSGALRKTQILYRAEVSQEGLGYMLFEPLFSAGFNSRLRQGLEAMKARAETTF